MYLLIRYTILAITLIALLIYIFTNRKRKVVDNSAKSMSPENANKKRWCAAIILIVFITAIFYPYEKHFARFDTIEKSVYYSAFDNPLDMLGSEIYYTEDDDTAFVVIKRNNNYKYTSTQKLDGGYGYCGDNIKVKLNSSTPQVTHIKTETFEGAADTDTIYNKNTDKTCYVVSLLSTNTENGTLEIHNESGDRMDTFKNSDGKTIGYYYHIEKGKPKDTFTFTLDGQQFQTDI